MKLFFLLFLLLYFVLAFVLELYAQERLWLLRDVSQYVLFPLSFILAFLFLLPHYSKAEVFGCFCHLLLLSRLWPWLECFYEASEEEALSQIFVYYLNWSLLLSALAWCLLLEPLFWLFPMSESSEIFLRDVRLLPAIAAMFFADQLIIMASQIPVPPLECRFLRKAQWFLIQRHWYYNPLSFWNRFRQVWYYFNYLPLTLILLCLFAFRSDIILSLPFPLLILCLLFLLFYWLTDMVARYLLWRDTKPIIERQLAWEKKRTSKKNQDATSL